MKMQDFLNCTWYKMGGEAGNTGDTGGTGGTGDTILQTAPAVSNTRTIISTINKTERHFLFAECK